MKSRANFVTPVQFDRFLKLLSSFFLFLFFPAFILAADRVDQTFNTVPSRDFSGSNLNSTGSMIIQPDGKLLIFGSFKVVNGVAVSSLVRLNPDGTLDNSFNCGECKDMAGISVLLQPDGRIVVAGSVNPHPNIAYSRSKVIRINSDGSRDSTFSVALTESSPITYYGAVVFSQQTDGKIFLGQAQSFQGQSLIWLFRLNTDGSFDNSFTSFFTNTRLGRGFVSGITQTPGGKLYLYGATAFGTFARLNADGTEDMTFEKPSFTAENPFFVPASVRDIVIQPNSKIVIAGNFIGINGFSKTNFARINPDGSLDLKFTELPDYFIPPLDEYLDGKLLISKRTDIAGLAFPEKLNADGGTDAAFNFPENLETVQNFVLETTTNKIYIYGRFLENGVGINKFARLNADGSLDPAFDVAVGNGGIVNGVAIQADQKVVMTGTFDRVNNTARSNIARVNPDGSVDPSFNSGSGANVPARDVVVAGNGQLYVYGEFTGFNGQTRTRIARLNSDGSLDMGFAPDVDNSILTLTLQTDGKILIGGYFANVNGQAVKGVARLNTDGTFDNTFVPSFGSVGGILKILVQTDEKIMIGGQFTGVGGFNRSNLARFNSDGSYDSSFNPSISTVKDLARTPDGNYVAVTNRIIKLNSAGATVGGFNSPVFERYSSSSGPQSLRVLIQPDNGFVVTGDFDLVDGIPHQGIVRLYPNGRLATPSYPIGTKGFVYDIAAQTDGKIVIGGEFSLFENVIRAGVARSNVPVLSQIVDYDFDYDGKADVAVFRPSENRWYVLRSSDFGVTQKVFGIIGDTPSPADFDGDGKTDYAIFRSSLGDWWSLSSLSGTQIFAHLGTGGDFARPSDFDGDGRADYIVYRPTDFVWYRVSSGNGQISHKQFGAAGDKPLIGDFDGDGKSDPAIYRPSDGNWWWQSSVDNIQRATHWGIATDIPTPGDFDGDGITDFAVYRPATGVWYIYKSSDGQFLILPFGIAEDKPVPADYDGDGRTDIAVYRPSSGIWYLLRSTDGFAAYQFGISTDIPIPNAFIP